MIVSSISHVAYSDTRWMMLIVSLVGNEQFAWKVVHVGYRNGFNRECTFTCGPNWECMHLCALRRESALSGGPKQYCTLPDRSVCGWLMGYLLRRRLPLSCFRTLRLGHAAFQCAVRVDSPRSFDARGCLSTSGPVRTSVVHHLEWKSLDGMRLLE